MSWKNICNDEGFEEESGRKQEFTEPKKKKRKKNKN